MQKIVSITSQGQVTIPKKWLRELGVKGSTKAVVTKKGKKLEIEPKSDLWSLKGSLSGKVRLTDKQLREARASFEKNWAEE